METNPNEVDQMNEETFVVKELEGRVYFETLPLLTVGANSWADDMNPHTPQAVTGIRG